MAELIFNSFEQFKQHYLPDTCERERIAKLPLVEQWIAEMDMQRRRAKTADRIDMIDFFGATVIEGI